MLTSLYRAVDRAELADIRAADGRLRQGTLEGKHLATTRADAQAWGATLYPDGYVVVRVEIPEEDLQRLYRWDRLDGIGPAYFGTIEELSLARVREVYDEP